MMQTSQIEIRDNQWIIQTKKSPFLVNFFIGLLSVTMFLIPIISMLMMLNYREDIRFGMFIGFGFSWFMSYLMTRRFLWNVYGREIVTFHKNKITYYADFKYFQDSHIELESENFDMYVLDIQEWDIVLGKIVIANSEGEIELAIKIPFADAKSLVEEFLNRE